MHFLHVFNFLNVDKFKLIDLSGNQALWNFIKPFEVPQRIVKIKIDVI